MATDWHNAEIKGELPPYARLYPVIAIIARGKLLDWWIHKYYPGAEFRTAHPGMSGHLVVKNYYPDNPRTPHQQGNRTVFHDGVKNWQGFTDETKKYYNERAKPIGEYGYHKYLSLYLKANYPMIIYWETLEKSATDPATVPDYISSGHQSLENKELVYPSIKTGFLGTAKATGAEIDTGTSGAKIVTPKAIADSLIQTGWTPARETWTRASASTITVPAGATSKYQKGDKIRLKQGGGWKYFYVVEVANTLLTVTGGSDYTVADATITDNYYSKVENPQGFPGWFTYTATVTASGSMTIGSLHSYLCVFKISGNTCTVGHFFDFTTGGTASNTIYATLPVNAADVPNRWCSGARIRSGASASWAGYTMISEADKVNYLAYDASNFPLQAYRQVAATFTYRY